MAYYTGGCGFRWHGSNPIFFTRILAGAIHNTDSHNVVRRGSQSVSILLCFRLYIIIIIIYLCESIDSIKLS